MLKIKDFIEILEFMDKLIVSEDDGKMLLTLTHYGGDNLKFNGTLSKFNTISSNTLMYLINLKINLLDEDISLIDYYGYDVLELTTKLKNDSPILDNYNSILIHKLINSDYFYYLEDDINYIDLIIEECPEYKDVDIEILKIILNSDSGFTTFFIYNDYLNIYNKFSNKEINYDEILKLEIEIIKSYELEDILSIDESELCTNETITDVMWMIDFALSIGDKEWFLQLSDKLNKIKK